MIHCYYSSCLIVKSESLNLSEVFQMITQRRTFEQTKILTTHFPNIYISKLFRYYFILINTKSENVKTKVL